jgi:hypothetical protein
MPGVAAPLAAEPFRSAPRREAAAGAKSLETWFGDDFMTLMFFAIASLA